MRLDEILYLIPLWLLRSSVFVFGLLWGSFLNVVIYRVPREMSVVRPGSHCPGCGKPIHAYDNLPVLSYVILRGRARCCGARMSPRYPLVELIGGALSIAIFEVVILHLPGSTPAHRVAAIYGADFALCLGLVAAAFIDAEHMFLPDSVTIGGTILGIATATVRDLAFTESLIGAVVGFLVIYVPFIFLYKGLLGRTGMGLGDAKLLALAGAWFGWPGAIFTLLAGAVQGSLFAGVTRVLGIELKLPDAVLEDIAELEKLAAEGDEEAKKALAEDPLTEDENDAFLLRFFKKLLGMDDGKSDAKKDTTDTTEEKDAKAEDAKDKDAKSDEAEDDAVDEGPPRARLPFGPFLILAILELLFAGDWLRANVLPALWPAM